MRRVSRQACEDGPLLDSQETEGQRQLHSLLVQQLHTDVDIDRLVAKRHCFAPAALYKPFGEQASGVKSLSQFQALQDGDQELANLRELGLTDAEIQLWLTRDAPESTENGHRVCATPSARQQRLQVIVDKMAARSELLARPQRFTASRALSRREMEIEQALFHGNDRLGFLTALYHQDKEIQQGATSSSDPMDSLYRDVFTKEEQPLLSHKPKSTGLSNISTITVDQAQGSLNKTGQSQDSLCDTGRSLGLEIDIYKQKDRKENEVELELKRGLSDQSELRLDTLNCGQTQQLRKTQFVSPTNLNISQPIGSLCVAGTSGPLTVKGAIEDIPDEDILKNREPEEGIRCIPRFQNYQPGEVSKVLCVKNLSPRASVAQLVALFSRFERQGGPAMRYRLLTGRMKGQAFITLPDTETSQKALELIHGYRLLGKPLVIEFGRERREEDEEPGRGRTT